MTKYFLPKIILFALLHCCLWASVDAQAIEVDGKLRLLHTDPANTIDSLVVIRPGGELARRHLSTLPGDLAGWTKLADTTFTLKKVGIGTDSPTAILTLDGTYSNPLIPGIASNGILRIGPAFNEALDIGKKFNGTFDVWLQAGFNGTTVDPISLQPLGGKVGIGLLSPQATLHVNGNVIVGGIIEGVANPVSPQDAVNKAYADNTFVNSPSSPVAGSILYFNGSDWVLLPPGLEDQVLTINDSIPEWAESPCDLYLGQFYLGGYIFYLDGTGCHGLVAATRDHNTNVDWGCTNLLIGTSAAVGTGETNTADIAIECNESGIAAKICQNIVLGGYDDWFLPSKDELELMWTNLASNNIGGFTTEGYWSSTESDAYAAFGRNFANGGSFAIVKSNYQPKRVRPVRAF